MSAHVLRVLASSWDPGASSGRDWRGEGPTEVAKYTSCSPGGDACRGCVTHVMECGHKGSWEEGGRQGWKNLGPRGPNARLRSLLHLPESKSSVTWELGGDYCGNRLGRPTQQLCAELSRGVGGRQGPSQDNLTVWA